MNTPATTPRSTACGGCGSNQRRILHHVSGLRRLCTSCVLLQHRSSFCPKCLHLHEPERASLRLVACASCPALAHPQCASPGLYLCPPCADPDFTFLDSGDQRRLAGALLCAARIASGLMSGAAVAARVEAVRRAEEATIARKRAREALDVLARVVNVEKAKARRREEGVRRGGGGEGFVAENADPSERVDNVGSSVGKADSVSDNVQKLPLHNSNGNVDKDSISDNVQKLPLHNSNENVDKSLA